MAVRPSAEGSWSPAAGSPPSAARPRRDVGTVRSATRSRSRCSGPPDHHHQHAFVAGNVLNNDGLRFAFGEDGIDVGVAALAHFGLAQDQRMSQRVGQGHAPVHKKLVACGQRMRMKPRKLVFGLVLCIRSPGWRPFAIGLKKRKRSPWTALSSSVYDPIVRATSAAWSWWLRPS